MSIRSTATSHFVTDLNAGGWEVEASVLTFSQIYLMPSIFWEFSYIKRIVRVF